VSDTGFKKECFFERNRRTRIKHPCVVLLGATIPAEQKNAVDMEDINMKNDLLYRPSLLERDKRVRSAERCYKKLIVGNMKLKNKTHPL
jgi:hypothetical protein